jgi:NAD(P)-dependent dehydrogenase (short-subunit alcohol dehydrogenase family)
MFNLNKKKILVTGAQGQLGQGIVLALLRAGAHVHITDIYKTISKDFSQLLDKEKFSDFDYTILDVTRQKSIEKVAAAIGPIDVLVNNAGVSVFTPFENRSEDEIDQVMDINTKGTILCCKIFSQEMKKRKKGAIVNIASVYGVVPADKKIYGNSGRNSPEIYGATKAGIIQMTRYLGAYLGGYGITVNSISPGGIFNNQKKIFVDNYVRKTPLGRMAKVEDVAGVVCFLSSSDADYITGQNITVDGGFSLNQ